MYWTFKTFSLQCLEFLPLLLSSHLKVWAIILSNKGAVTLAQNCNLLLNVFYLILCFLQIYNFNSHHLLCAVVDAFVNFSKGSLSNPFLFGEVLLGVQPGILATLEQRKEQNAYVDSCTVNEPWAKSSCKSRLLQLNSLLTRLNRKLSETGHSMSTSWYTCNSKKVDNTTT